MPATLAPPSDSVLMFQEISSRELATENPKVDWLLEGWKQKRCQESFLAKGSSHEWLCSSAIRS
jgi:hypothetical protein